MAFSGSNTKLIVNNRLPDALFEQNVSSVVTFDDGASATPTDLTGGTASSISVSRNTSSPLHGSADLLITRAAANAQGEGAAIAFSLDNGDQTQVMEVSFSYKTSANYADNDLVLWLYDVTNAVLIQPAEGYQLKADLVAGRHRAIFQASSNSTSYRLGFFCPVNSSTAWTVEVDNLAVRPAEYQAGMPATDWQSYVPTGSWSTNTTYAGKWRRVGDSAEYDIKITLSGAPTSASLAVNLNPGHVIDTAKMSYGASTNYNLGELQILDSSGGNTWQGKVRYSDTVSIGAVFMSVTGSEVDVSTVNSTSPITFASGDTVYLRFKLPILGWSSSVLMSDQADQRITVARYYRSTAQSLANSTEVIMDYSTKQYDTHSAVTTGASWKYTAPTAGYYRINASCDIDAASWNIGEAHYLILYKNGVAATSPYQILNFDAKTGVASARSVVTGSTTIYLNANEYISVAALQNSGASVNTTADGGSNFIEVEKVQGPSSITSTELVSVIANNVSGQSFTNNTYTTVTNWTELQDTHAAFVASTGVFTVPIAGTYSLNGMISFNSNATGVRELRIRKNGGAQDILFDRQVGSSDGNYLSGSTVIKCNQGDTLQLQAFQNSGGSLAIIAINEYQRFEITKVGI